MKEVKETTKTNVLLQIWQRSSKEWDAIKQNFALRKLRSDAETDLLNMQSELEARKETVNKAILDCKDTPNYKSIREAAVRRDVFKAEFEVAKSLYVEFFGKHPDFLE